MTSNSVQEISTSEASARQRHDDFDVRVSPKFVLDVLENEQALARLKKASNIAETVYQAGSVAIGKSSIESLKGQIGKLQKRLSDMDELSPEFETEYDLLESLSVALEVVESYLTPKHMKAAAH